MCTLLCVRTVSLKYIEQLVDFSNSYPFHIKFYDRWRVFFYFDTKNRWNHEKFLPKVWITEFFETAIRIFNVAVLGMCRFVAGGGTRRLMAAYWRALSIPRNKRINPSTKKKDPYRTRKNGTEIDSKGLKVDIAFVSSAFHTLDIKQIPRISQRHSIKSKRRTLSRSLLSKVEQK